MVDWTSIMAMDVEPAVEAMTPVLESLGAALDAEPALAAEFHEILERELGGEITADTLPEVTESTWALVGLGDGPVRLLIWVVRTSDSEARQHAVDALAGRAPARVARLIRDTIAHHGGELVEAYRRWGETPDDWSRFSREVYYDVITGAVKLHIVVRKFNGEELKLECDPNSLVSLTANIVDTLTHAASMNAFDQARLDEMRRTIDGFWNSIEAARKLPPGDAAPTDGAPSEAGG